MMERRGARKIFESKRRTAQLSKFVNRKTTKPGIRKYAMRRKPYRNRTVEIQNLNRLEKPSCKTIVR